MKVLSWRFWKNLRPWKGVLKWCFLESGLNMSFTVGNFRKKVTMTITFFFKMFKIWFKFQKWNKISEKAFCFKDNCIWIGAGKFSQSGTGYLSLAVNVLGNSHKIQHITEGDISKSGFPRMMKKDEKSAPMLLLQKFGTFQHVDSQRVFWNDNFWRVV